MKTFETNLLGSLLKTSANEATSFYQALEKLAEKATPPRLSFDKIDVHLGGRGSIALSIVLCLPFLQPIPLPGLSVFLGVAMMAIGANLALGRAGTLPGFIKRREIDTATFKKIVSGAKRVFSYLERLLKPRLEIMNRRPLINLLGFSIMMSGLALSLPLPPIVPFSNAIPAWAIVCLCLGYLERDGLVVLIGHGLTVFTWGYFAFIWDTLVMVIQKMIASFLF
jgi:hypothetical protein